MEPACIEPHLSRVCDHSYPSGLRSGTMTQSTAASTAAASHCAGAEEKCTTSLPSTAQSAGHTIYTV